MTSPDTKDIAGELAALANATGGVLFLGIDDSGAVRGIPSEHVDTVENRSVNVATHDREPPIRAILRKELLPDLVGGERRVLLAKVPRGLYLHRTSGGRYYISLPPNAILRPRSLSGSSSSGAASTFSTNNP